MSEQAPLKTVSLCGVTFTVEGGPRNGEWHIVFMGGLNYIPAHWPLHGVSQGDDG